MLSIYAYVLTTYFLFIASAQRIDLRICSKTGNEQQCQQIARSGIACSPQLHEVDCLQNLVYNHSHFGRIDSEAAWLGANLVDENIIVLGEISDEINPPLQTAVLIKKEIDVEHNFNDLKGRKFCHPGLNHDDAISKLLLEEFENSLVSNSDLCASNSLTIVENKYSSLSKYFGDSCRPGPWTYNFNLDKQLKSKYSSLCKLCNGATCDEVYADPFNNTLECLSNGGDIALTTLRNAKTFLENPENYRKFTYLCKDGRASETPCFWSGALPDVIVAHGNFLSSAKSTFEKYLAKKINTAIAALGASDETTTKALETILNLKNKEKINLYNNQQSLKSFVNERRKVPDLIEANKCGNTVKWCTHSLAENEKCKWLSQAALNEGVLPVIECVQKDESELSCLDIVNRNDADIVTASADQAYITLKKDLISVAFPETNTLYLNTILLVKRSDDDSITNFATLKNKKACFPQYGGKEFLSFVEAAKSQKVIDTKSCQYDKLVSNFISSGCLPGVRSSLLSEITEDVDKDKFCELCQSSETDSETSTVCNADKKNLFYGSLGSLKCLEMKSADFAVITRPFHKKINDSQYQVICKNGSLASNSGLNVDDDCALNIITSSEVVIQKDNKEKSNIVSMLYEFEQLFGKSFQKSFHIFDQFNNTRNLLFADSTPGLTFPDDDLHPEKWVENYRTLLRHAGECSSASTITAALSLMILCLFVQNNFQ